MLRELFMGHLSGVVDHLIQCYYLLQTSSFLPLSPFLTCFQAGGDDSKGGGERGSIVQPPTQCLTLGLIWSNLCPLPPCKKYRAREVVLQQGSAVLGPKAAQAGIIQQFQHCSQSAFQHCSQTIDHPLQYQPQISQTSFVDDLVQSIFFLHVLHRLLPLGLEGTGLDLHLGRSQTFVKVVLFGYSIWKALSQAGLSQMASSIFNLALLHNHETNFKMINTLPYKFIISSKYQQKILYYNN